MSQHLGHCSPNRREDYDIIIMFCEQVCLCASHVDLRVVVENRSRSESRKPLSRMGMSTSLICVDDNAAYQPSSPNYSCVFHLSGYCHWQQIWTISILARARDCQQSTCSRVVADGQAINILVVSHRKVSSKRRLRQPFPSVLLLVIVALSAFSLGKPSYSLF